MSLLTSIFEAVDERLFATVLLAVVLYIVIRVLEWLAQRGIKDEHWQYTALKAIRYAALAIFLISLISIWAQRLQGLLLIMGATGAGLAIALAPVIVSIAGWSLITWSRLFKVGDRIEIGGVTGDVVDIGIIRTTMLEIGNWVGADQLTGRTVVIANSVVLKDPVYNYTTGCPFIWDEFTIPICYGPKWNRAQEVALEAILDYGAEVEPRARVGLRELPGMRLVGLPDTKPQTYISLTEHWVSLTVRYVVQARARRSIKHRLQMQVLRALTKEQIEVAAPSLTVVRYPSERTWKEEA